MKGEGAAGSCATGGQIISSYALDISLSSRLPYSQWFNSLKSQCHLNITRLKSGYLSDLMEVRFLGWV
jgi:hypothetical protein